MNKISISYCLCVWNESSELDLLLKHLFRFIDIDDEIVIQGDQGKVTNEVISVIRSAMKDSRVKYLEFPLKKDFASFKNNLIRNCSKDYCFLLDPDEIPHDVMLANLKMLLAENPDVDMFRVPRINIVLGLTSEYAKHQRWNVQNITVPKLDYDAKNILAKYGIAENNGWEGRLEIEVVNLPDYQSRIFKNKPEIRYNGDFKVHEQLDGANVWTGLPFQMQVHPNQIDLTWCLFHVKTIQRQKNQNNFYNSFQ